MKKITATFRVVTPMFLGGAKPSECAELRVPSIKGMLRFWLRALHPNYQDAERRLFGKAGEGQSLVALSINPALTSIEDWNPAAFNRYTCNHPGMPSGLSPAAARTWQLNGVKYFGYPLRMGDNRRKYIRPDTSFTLCVIFHPKADESDIKGLVAALWLLGHLGGLGSRSRRAFGSLRLEQLDYSPNLTHLVEPAFLAASLDQWLQRFEAGYRTITAWFGGVRKPDHSVLGIVAALKVQPIPCASWDEAMHQTGYAMQIFRQRRAPDYGDVKAHLCKRYSEAAKLTPSVSPNWLTQAPERLNFGLPLRFQFTSLRYPLIKNGKPITHKDGTTVEIPPDVTFLGDKIVSSSGDSTIMDRVASPIHARVLKLGDSYYPMYVRLNAPQPSRCFEQDAPGSAKGLRHPSSTILDDFWSSLSGWGELKLP